jgi:hypothetical protein
MNGSKLVAWAIALVVVAVSIAVLAGETTVVHHLTRLHTAPSHLSALIKETKAIGWEISASVMMLVLLWVKLR